MAALPLLVLFLCGSLGHSEGYVTDSPVSVDPSSSLVPVAEGGGADEGTPDQNSTAHDLDLHIRNNTVAVIQLNNLLLKFMEVAEDQSCIDIKVNNAVADLMTEGYKSVMESMKSLNNTLRVFQLMKWRLDFIHSLGIPLMDKTKPCPLPFYKLLGECFYFESKVKRTFQIAQLSCSLMGGFVAEPEKLSKFSKHVQRMMPGSIIEVFIGAVANPDGTWQWKSSGLAIDDIPWHASHEGGDNACLLTKEGTYKSVDCGSARNYACEIAL